MKFGSSSVVGIEVQNPGAKGRVELEGDICKAIDLRNSFLGGGDLCTPWDMRLVYPPTLIC